MSVPSTVKGQYFDVAVDVTGLGLTNGGNALTGFVVLCGLNTKSMTHQVSTSDEAVPDCDRPADAPWRVLNATSQQADISGTGVHNTAQASIIRAIFGHTRPYKFIEAKPDGTDPNVKDEIGHWSGPFKLTNWQQGATGGADVTAQFTFASDGQITWTDAV